MSMQFNFVGRLAKDPEFKSDNNVKVLKLNAISNEQYKVGIEWKNRSDSFYLDLYGPLGEKMYNAQTFGKGDLVHVQGRIRNHSYVKNGVTVYRDVYIIDKIDRLISVRNQNNRGTSYPHSQIDESFYPDTFQPVEQQSQNSNAMVMPKASPVDEDTPF